jgi:glycosyltransferase involved in cell wall biosynthesis
MNLQSPAERGSLKAPVQRRGTVLVIGMAASIHVVRWMNMVSGCPDLRFVLCPVFRARPELVAKGFEFINPNFAGVRMVRERQDTEDMPPGEFGIFDLESVPEDELAAAGRATGFQPFHPSYLPADRGFAEPGHVAAAVRRFRPALVISLEVQFAGYLTLAAKDYLGSEFPRWLLSNWGSDIYLYRKLEAHQPKLRRIAESIDAYIAECRRDASIVRQMGFRGRMLPAMPASGGVDFADFPPLESFEKPSLRRQIQVKGYHGWSGRALHILAAVHLAASALSNFAVRVTLAGPEVVDMVETTARRDGLDIACEPYVASHTESIARLGRARISVGLGISDGISTTLLESMAVGAFPIKGTSSCACEWVDNGRTGIVVSPHDIRALADGLIRAATDDDLVESAAPINRATVEQRWDAARNRQVLVGHLLELAT